LDIDFEIHISKINPKGIHIISSKWFTTA
jgi:hypothetical protein